MKSRWLVLSFTRFFRPWEPRRNALRATKVCTSTQCKTPRMIVTLMPGSCKPSREQYIAWGTEECWNDNDVAMRGARNLLDVLGHCSRMEATYHRKTSGHPSGVLYWQITILDEQIDAVESIPEVRALDFLSAVQPRVMSNHEQIREVELANSGFDPHYDVGRPIPNREKRAMKPSKPRWMPRDMDLVGAVMAGCFRFSLHDRQKESRHIHCM